MGCVAGFIMSAPPIVIAGTGAMACLFGARLARHTPVTLLGMWPEGLAALQSGIEWNEPDGSQEVIKVKATSDPAQCQGAALALVLVKSWQTARAARQLRECLAPDGLALTLQNGLGNLEILQDALGPERAALGVTTTGATLLGPGKVRPGGSGPTHLAPHTGLEPLIELLRGAGFEVKLHDDLQSLVWGKLAVNAGINPLTALLDVPNGTLLDDRATRALMVAAAEETADVARAQGITLPYADASFQVMDVARRTAKNISSMLADMRRGAPTEVDAINGAVVEHGERLQVPTPVNWTLWRMVQARVRLHPGEEQ
jgi:2-dehydropantoate 2-reductase